MNTRTLPFLPISEQLDPILERYIEQLKSEGFEGTLESDLARRLVCSTDNSVYQLIPQGILYPRHVADVMAAMKLITAPEFNGLCITPRGGGTGTNGQSLTTGISLDLSRYFDSILDINLEEGWVEVEAGVVLDQLNDALAHTGFFFAPNLSPSSRATIGGMINTDAAGKGSRIYGKTSDHILSLELVLLGGERVHLSPQSSQEIKRASAEEPNGFMARVASPLLEIALKEKAHIDEIFPNLNRFMTGYNLKMMYDHGSDVLDLTRLIAGSEGTLGVVTKARLKLTPQPKSRRLILFSYSTFQDALGSAQILLDQNPSAIETIDHNILNLARQDASYLEVKDALEGSGLSPSEVQAINLVEFEASTEEEVLSFVESCLTSLRPQYGTARAPIGDTVAHSPLEQSALWGLRKRGVGLLAARPGKRKPIAFVEDTVVPPERLSDYIADFTKILDSEGVEYGLFGHVDVGCLHVRPALDLRDPKDEEIFARISDRVSSLVRSYGGLIWGEHGKGIRSAYSPDYFKSLYPVLQEVKRLFDPLNQLNPGKVATPDERSALLPLNSPLRAHHDRMISPENLSGFMATVTCNGNGQCFDYHPDHVMCPSVKVTRDRLHSPKGRASIMRAWLKALSERGVQLEDHDFNPKHIELENGLRRLIKIFKAPLNLIKKRYRAIRRNEDFSSQVYEAMSGCLSCKACASACPVKVDVPQFKARFLHLFYERYPRPLRDYLIGALEPLAILGSRAPWLWNLSLKLPGVRLLNRQILGLVDPPSLSPRSALKELKSIGALTASDQNILALRHELRSKAVILVPDTFSALFDAPTLVDAYHTLTTLGFTVLLAPLSPNGKGYHVKGRLKAFKRNAQKHYALLASLSAHSIPMICLDPAVALTYRDEYIEALGEDKRLPIVMVQEWLSTQIDQLPQEILIGSGSVQLFAHCTERSLSPSTHKDWINLFKRLGVDCIPASVGCCGMCGIYGHEEEHVANSKALFESSWAGGLKRSIDLNLTPMMTGYSCRSQVKRCLDHDPSIKVKARHPLSVLRLKLEEAKASVT